MKLNIGIMTWETDKPVWRNVPVELPGNAFIQRILIDAIGENNTLRLADLDLVNGSLPLAGKDEPEEEPESPESRTASALERLATVAEWFKTMAEVEMSQ